MARARGPPAGDAGTARLSASTASSTYGAPLSPTGRSGRLRGQSAFRWRKVASTFGYFPPPCGLDCWLSTRPLRATAITAAASAPLSAKSPTQFARRFLLIAERLRHPLGPVRDGAAGLRGRLRCPTAPESLELYRRPVRGRPSVHLRRLHHHSVARNSNFTRTESARILPSSLPVMDDQAGGTRPISYLSWATRFESNAGSLLVVWGKQNGD